MRRKCRPACEKTPVPEKARLYLLAPAADGLVPRPERSFWWGYGYYGIFAALAALGAAFEGVAEQPSREWPSSLRGSGRAAHHPIVAPCGRVGFAVAWFHECRTTSAATAGWLRCGLPSCGSRRSLRRGSPGPTGNRNRTSVQTGPPIRCRCVNRQRLQVSVRDHMNSEWAMAPVARGSEQPLDQPGWSRRHLVLHPRLAV